MRFFYYKESLNSYRAKNYIIKIITIITENVWILRHYYVLWKSFNSDW